jgi:3-deoxy-D-manno-octulosonic-acid transferase
MLIIYRILINIIFILSPLIFFYRIFKKKESLYRFIEKLSFFSKKRKRGNLIWFHGASVGELKSIIPLLEKFEKNKQIKQILITSNTLSSAKIINKLKLRKITHQFFPIDSNFLIKKFLNYWQPKKAIFIDSEIWPNTIINLKKFNIPIILINARITNKTFKRWMTISSLSKKIFSKIDLCLASSKESFRYLKILNVKKIKLIGNLKFTQSKNQKISKIKNLEKYLKKKKYWCASSTHNNEEVICAKTHLELKKKFKNLSTIIIPRHINRCEEIKKKLEKFHLKIQIVNNLKNLNSNSDILLINLYGQNELIFKYIKHVFLGGSLINHGGQNPIEPAIFGCNILHGPNVENFKEIYKFLKKNKISFEVNNQQQLTNKLSKLFNQNIKFNSIEKKLSSIGKNILEKSYKQIDI